MLLEGVGREDCPDKAKKIIITTNKSQRPGIVVHTLTLALKSEGWAGRSEFKASLVSIACLEIIVIIIVVVIIIMMMIIIMTVLDDMFVWRAYKLSIKFL